MTEELVGLETELNQRDTSHDTSIGLNGDTRDQRYVKTEDLVGMETKFNQRHVIRQNIWLEWKQN